MNIVIIGGGAVGSAVCTQLSEEGHNVTLVDKDASLLSEVSNICDVFGVAGNGADVSVLRRAGGERADLLIAITAEDEINLLSCMAARRLGARHTVARVRNPAYGELVQLMRKEHSLSFTINPELAAAREIYRTLRFPAAAKIDTFCRGRVEVAEFSLSEECPLVGKSLYDLRNELHSHFLVCAVMRDGVPYIPSGNFVLREGDLVSITAPETEIAAFFRAIGLYKNPVRRVLIAGGGRVSYYLCELLQKSKIDTTVIEKDKERCRLLAEHFPACTVVCDNFTKQETLLEEGIETTDAFLALSDIDEENAIISLYAKTREVPKIVTLIGTMSYIDFFKSAGLEGVVSPKLSTAAGLVRYVRSINGEKDSEIESLYKLFDGSVEVLEFLVKEEIEGLTDLPLKDLRAREGILIACIMHENEIVIPKGDDVIRNGDTVLVVSLGGQLKNIGDIVK